MAATSSTLGHTAIVGNLSLPTRKASATASSRRSGFLLPTPNLRSRRRDPLATTFCANGGDSTFCLRSGVRSFSKGGRVPGSLAAAVSSLDALIFDCDGVILESEDLHRCAYNATFEHFNVRCFGNKSAPVEWTTEFYDVLQNTIGGGKPKMRWYFKKQGWPSSTLFTTPPSTEEDQTALIDALQDWKTAKYKDMIASGAVEARPGIVSLMDSARAQGIKVAICSAATKSSVVFCVENLIGKERMAALDCFMAGDDVDKKKPDPTIYRVASQRLGVPPEKCLVVEDSLIGLEAALGANMRCIITYTSSTQNQAFFGASAVYPDLSNVGLQDLLLLVS